MITAKKLIIVDMDGTLFDSSERFTECQKLSGGNKKQFWSCFQSSQFMHLDKPINSIVNYVKSLIDENSVVIVVSGRSKEKQFNETVEQLKTIGITPHEIYMREPKDFRKDFEFKGVIVQQLLEKYKPNQVIVIDDSNDVIQFIRAKFPQVTVIDAKSLY